MERVYNFSAGPTTLPKVILEEAAKEMLNYRNSGMSVMEMSHRSNIYNKIHNEAKNDLKDLLNLSDDYEILFLQGGAWNQFSMVPMNLLKGDAFAYYLITGAWANHAYKEASRFGDVRILASSEDKDFIYVPKINENEMEEGARYLYVCTNNTIYGTRSTPKSLEGLKTRIVADMSSNILSEVYDMNTFDIAFAGAQKNMGPAGVTVVIIKKEIIGEPQERTPKLMDYRTQFNKNSLFNTPPSYPIYMVGKVAKWLKSQGGVHVMEKINKEKAKLLYDFIDESEIFNNPVAVEDRSIMNVVFVTGDPDLDMSFIKGAESEGLVNLKGHRSVGGMRASIYNAMPIEGVKKLVDYMKDFEMENK